MHRVDRACDLDYLGRGRLRIGVRAGLGEFQLSCAFFVHAVLPVRQPVGEDLSLHLCNRGEAIMSKDRMFETGFITLSVISIAVLVWAIFSI